MAKQAKKLNKIGEVAKKIKKIRVCYKKVTKNFQTSKKGQQNISKVDTINLAQFLVCRVQHNHEQT